MRISNNHRPMHSVIAVLILLLLIYLKYQNDILLWFALVLVLCGFLFKPARLFIDYIWIGIAKVLGAIVPRIILTVFYYFILTPVALLSKLFTKTDLLKLKKPKDSSFTSLEKIIDEDLFKNPW